LLEAVHRRERRSSLPGGRQAQFLLADIVYGVLVTSQVVRPRENLLRVFPVVGLMRSQL
jgi:hypothetical protein